MFDHHAEAVDRGGIEFFLEVVAPDLHLLAGEVVEGEVEFQDRRLGVFAVRILLDHRAQRLKRLKGQALIAADIVDLVVIGQRQKIAGIGRILGPRIGVEVALRGGAAVFVLARLVIAIGLHDQRALGPFGIGVKAFHLAEIADRAVRPLGIGQFRLAQLVDLLGVHVLKGDLLGPLPGAARQNDGQRQRADKICR